MSTQFQFKELNGVSGSQVETAMINLNFGAVDAPNLAVTSYPIAAGTNSYAKYFIAFWSGDFTQISNVRAWLPSGSYVTGELIAFSGSMEYTSPINTLTGDPSIPTSWPATPNVSIPWWKYPGFNPYAGSSTIGVIAGSGATSGSSQIMRIQLQTTSATPGGAVHQKTFAITYDQI